MHADMFVVRHAESGAPYLIAKHCAPHVHVVNAGDGRHAHPTQGLLDMYTIRHFKRDFTQLTVAIVGDIVHSRVARCDIHALTMLGVPEIRAVGPRTLVPGDLREMGVRVCHDMADGMRDADVIIMLRLQNERMSGALLPSAGEFFKTFGLTDGEARAGEARRDRHAPRADQSRRRDRLVGCRRPAQRDPAAGDFRHRGAHGGDVDHRGQRGMSLARAMARIDARSADALMKILVSSGRVIDPASGRDERADVAIADGRIVAIGTRRRRFRCRSQHRRRRACVVAPGLVDLAARLREPGHEHEGMLESELNAAAAGGVTSLVCPPDTDPPLDEPGLVEMLKFRARKLSRARLFPLGALTRGVGRRGAHRDGRAHRGRVRRLLAGRRRVADTLVLLRALQYAATYRLHGVAAAAGSVARAGRGRQRRRGDAARLVGRAGRGRNDRAAHDLRADARHRRARAPVPPVERGRRRAGALPPRPKACRSAPTSASTRCT